MCNYCRRELISAKGEITKSTFDREGLQFFSISFNKSLYYYNEEAQIDAFGQLRYTTRRQAEIMFTMRNRQSVCFDIQSCFSYIICKTQAVQAFFIWSNPAHKTPLYRSQTNVQTLSRNLSLFFRRALFTWERSRGFCAEGRGGFLGRRVAQRPLVASTRASGRRGPGGRRPAWAAARTGPPPRP